ncbi:MAG: hydrogenase iron-sulfur subunit, partial [Planctomycetota bacterium]|nr:hydrogenase iron-sulfur subunit [Planctomycetota bacterium]
DAVLILECSVGACRYPGVVERVRRRAEQAKRILDELKIGGGRVVLREGIAGDAEATARAVSEVMAGIGAGGKVLSARV